jgi:hypothetical protein
LWIKNSLDIGKMEIRADHKYTEKETNEAWALTVADGGKRDVQYEDKMNHKEGFIVLLAYWADGEENQQCQGGSG